jgi:hypothetical protein
MIRKLLALRRQPRRLGDPCAESGPTCRPVLEALENRCLPSSVDPILEWNAVALQANAVDHTAAGGEQPGPTLTGRALAIVHVAMFDAFNSIAQRFTPYLTMVPGGRGASIDAAVAQAAHDTLAALYPSQQAAFAIALNTTLARVPDGLREVQGVRVGHAVAQSILAERAGDGADANPPYTAAPGPGVHDLDPYHTDQGFYGVGHGDITPFALTSSTQFPAAAPPDLNSPAYTAAFNEVKALGGDGINTPTSRTPEQTQIGLFWGYDGSPGLGTPPRLYNQITRSLAEQMHNTVAENARLFALINVAMADAGIACWEVKYTHNFWRPILGIAHGDDDGNPETAGDQNWHYLGAPRSNAPGENSFTPNFPSYTSGHATFGASLFRTLANFYGRDDISFTVHSDEFNGTTMGEDGLARPVMTRSFTRFSDAAEENGQSRIYLGIHWSFDKVEGIRQGSAIADYVFASFFRPLTGQTASTHGEPSAAGNGGDPPGESAAPFAPVGAPVVSGASDLFLAPGANDVLAATVDPQFDASGPKDKLFVPTDVKATEQSPPNHSVQLEFAQDPLFGAIYVS